MSETNEEFNGQPETSGYIIWTVLAFVITMFVSCKKELDIPPPVGSVTTSQVFSNDNSAITAEEGMYYDMINSYEGLFTGGTTVFSGLSADELNVFDQTQTSEVQFQKNDLLNTNSISAGLWANAFSTIYNANAIIAGVADYSGVDDSTKSELTGESEFVLALCYFYLINFYGDVPYLNTINWQKTALLSRTDTVQVYQSIISDLIDAKRRLRTDYAVANGQRIVPNKWAAEALLARVYLYRGNYTSAESESDSIINNKNLYSLCQNPNNVFLTNSSEAIWQLMQYNLSYPYNATEEGYLLIPPILNSYYAPSFYITTELLSSFEAGDQRKVLWVDSTSYNNVEYYFPYKYKTGGGQATTGGAYTEYYMVLRLAEQYLIRAEAEAQLGNLASATADLNVIRSRAGLPNTTATSGPALLAAIAHENQIEFFSELGHRWLDLKRTGQATSILSIEKGLTISNNALLYPIPVGELQSDPNLTQNVGY